MGGARHLYGRRECKRNGTGAAGRAALIEVALDAPDEEWALFYQQMAELLDGYNDRTAPIVSLERFNRLVLARDQNGKALVIAPIDYLIWNERAASALEKVAKLLQLRPGENKCELWITGTASPLFKKEAEFSDILVEDRIVTSLPVLD